MNLKKQHKKIKKNNTRNKRPLNQNTTKKMNKYKKKSTSRIYRCYTINFYFYFKLFIVCNEYKICEINVDIK